MTPMTTNYPEYIFVSKATVEKPKLVSRVCLFIPTVEYVVEIGQQRLSVKTESVNKGTVPVTC